MGTKTITLLLLSWTLAQVNVNAAQPNDNFGDRIVLTGDDVVFTGNLTGSTIELDEPTNAPFYPGFPATHSVWWSWTATKTTPVTIVALSHSADTFLPGSDLTSALAVYAGTNVFGPPPATTTNVFWLNAAFNQLAMSFQAVAGSNYQIQFFGTDPTLTSTFRLIATNPPVLLDPPTPQTVFPGGSALFTVIASGPPPLSYQWQFEGSDLPGETSPMLALNNIAAGQAGAYGVVVSNATGVIISAPTNLRVTSSAAAPVLAPDRSGLSNSFGFVLSGEAGRYYRIQSSTDLVAWQNESSFSPIPVTLVYPTTGAPKSSVVYAGSSNLVLSVPSSGNAKFVRASVYVAPNEGCNNNLKRIRFAKELFVRTQLPVRLLTPAWSDFPPEMLTLFCPLARSGPADASYVINDVVSEPVCKILQAHVLEEPR